MNLILSLATLTSVALVHGQSGDKGIIPYPRVGRMDRFYMDGKRDGNLSPGLIPFPRIGRSDGGIHEGKRQLIPFPRVGKRPFWHFPMDPYLVDYEEYAYPIVETDPSGFRSGMRGMSSQTDPSALEENDNEKRASNNNNGGGGMLFGPRLGRRKRSIETDSSSEHSHETALDRRTLGKILHNFNWAIVPIKDRQTSSRSGCNTGIHRRSPPYIPRLGRSKEVASAEAEDETQDQHRKATQSTPSDTTGTSTRLNNDHLRLEHSGED